MTLGPTVASRSRTLSSRPRPIEETPITTATPITMPRTVNPERSLLVRMVSTAICRISPNSLLPIIGTRYFPALRQNRHSRDQTTFRYFLGSWLLVPQRFDWIEIGGLPCGINPEDQSDARGGTESERDPEQREFCRQCRPHSGNDPHDNGTGEDANDASHRGQHDCFEGELQKDVTLSGADCFAHANFARARGHTDQHEVHHAHAADHQANARDGEHPDEQGAGQLVPEIGDGIRGHDRKVVRLIEGNFPSTPHQFPNLVHRFRHIIVRGCLDADDVLLHLRMQGFESLQGQDDTVVIGILATTEHRLDFFHRADHLKQPALDVDLFAQRILIAKQLLLRLVTNHNHRRMVLIVEVAEPPAAGHGQVKDIFSLRHIPFDDRVFHLLVAVFYRVAANPQLGPKHAKPGRDRLHVGEIPYGQSIVVSKLLAHAHFIGQAAKGKEVQVKYENHIRPDAGDQIANVIVEATPDRGDPDDHRHADHNAENSQAGTQLVAANRVGGHLDDFAEFGFAHHTVSVTLTVISRDLELSIGELCSLYISNLRATIGSSRAALRAG